MMLQEYQTIIFDCDGVLLDSNKSKTEAFYAALSGYAEDERTAFINYHIANGGISRQRKFAHFLRHITSTDSLPEELDRLLASYAKNVKKLLLECSIAPRLDELRARTQSDWLVVSGGCQDEIHCVFKEREIYSYFNNGVYGNPRTKNEIIEECLDAGLIKGPTLFIGDSKYDYECAKTYGFDFVFLYAWTDWLDWRLYCNENNLAVRSAIADFVIELEEA